ncbi:unnamed protein product [Allacma fusca]|uniref:GDP-fucose protein O-fucosyltransferase 1 n=1 Tax=Allacma fusca TaxID=39272 RepID=A0A8J2M5Q5_9HEXA|nr:unnamed protein product [Allacma fusca]
MFPLLELNQNSRLACSTVPDFSAKFFQIQNYGGNHHTDTFVLFSNVNNNSIQVCSVEFAESYFGVIIWTAFIGSYCEALEIDPEGYIAFCPCMGRFGNQADQFLGALSFAKSINRTFVVPHWVEYVPYEAGSSQVPFSKYFNPGGIQKYHRAVTMDVFMAKIAPKIWPPEKRIAFCYAERNKNSGCDAKDGNPFGPYWDAFGVDFVGSEIFGPNLHYIGNLASYNSWYKKYPGDKWPVLAFVGSPGAFPVEEKNLHLQQYIEWNNSIKKEALKFISNLPKGPFIGIHLRNGVDWSRACELVDGTRDLFASPQCTGYGKKEAKLNMEMCLPSLNTITRQLKRAVKKRNATSIFVASDRSHLLF